MLTVGVEGSNGKDPKDPLFRRFAQLGSDGLTIDPQGRLVLCTWAGRSVDRIEKNGKRTVLADRYEGKRFGGPNDVVVKNDGAIYFSDTVGGMRGKEKDPSKELESQAIYMIKDGKVSVAIQDIPTPNGLAFSPDEKYFYANGSAANYIRRYRVQSDDTLTDGQLFIDLSTDKTPGFTDGMRVDAKGNLYTSGPGGVWIVSPEGKHLGTILTPELVANLAFGDPDYQTLYITARTTIYKIRVNTPGHHR
jgi:gluconolactonase